MKQYILTDQEREIIKKYVETGERLKGFRMLLSRCRHMGAISEDLAQIKWFLAKVEANQTKEA